VCEVRVKKVDNTNKIIDKSRESNNNRIDKVPARNKVLLFNSNHSLSPFFSLQTICGFLRLLFPLVWREGGTA
jgi:hypothetical protein